MRGIIGLTMALGLLAAAPTGAHAADSLRDLCPDRPGKGTSACTVDAGHWQLEVDAIDVTRDRSGGATTDSWVVADPNLKYGVTDTLDLEAGIAPYEAVHSRDHATGATTTDSGIGDFYLRAKDMVLSGQVSVALEPYVKLPTAKRSLGNGKAEAGVVVPLAQALPDGWSLGVTAEADALENAAGHGRHGAGSLTLGLSRGVGGGVNLGAELWGGWNFDPSGHGRQRSFDVSAAWIPVKDANLQLDGGVNLGLNRQTPQAQVYAGVSRRF